MSKRIGESLVQGGLVTRRQLEQALRTQLIFGGHLGTSFLELGFVREDDLGAALATIHGVPYATPDELANVSEAVIGQIPRKLAERYRVVPYRQERRLLRVAAMHPRDLQALDEIAFVTGFKIEPAVAPEIRILEALERYYGIPRPTRYISICRDLDEGRSRPVGVPTRPGSESARPVSSEPDPDPGDDERDGSSERSPVRAIAGPSDVRDVIPLSPDKSSEPEPSSQPEPETEPLGDEHADLSCQIGGNAALDDYGYGKPWHEVAEEQFDREDAASGRRPQRSGPRPGADEGTGEARALDEVIRSMAQAESREDLARALLGLGAHADLPRILFRVRGTVAEIWDHRGLTLPENIGRLALPVAHGSIFELLLGRECYLGPVPSGPEFRELYEALGRTVPARIFLMPAYLDSRLAAVLYLEIDGREARDVDAKQYRTILDALGMALELILLKRRIRSLAEPAAPRDAAPA